MGRTREIRDPGFTWDDAVPLSQAVRMGEFVYISGQVPIAPDGSIVGGDGDMAAQARQTLENVKASLEAAGARLEDVVKITTYVTDLSKIDDVFRVRHEYFPQNPPASTLIEISGLYKGLLIEIEAIAITD